jgi:N utilization substance protein B
MPRVVHNLLAGRPAWRGPVEQAEALADAVASEVERLDAEIEVLADNWRFERIGTIELNVLRIGLYELSAGSVPVRVAISEAVQLAHWFAGAKAPAFVNGVLDAAARKAGRL